MFSIILVVALSSVLSSSIVQAENDVTVIPANDASLSVDRVNDLNDTLNNSTSTYKLSMVEASVSVAKDILKDYYEDIDLGTEKPVKKLFKDTKLLAPSISDYLDKKINTKHYVVKAANAQKENYDLKFTLLSSEVTKEGILLTISTEASFNYVGLEVQSGFGEVSKNAV